MIQVTMKYQHIDFLHFLKDFIYLFLERGKGGREGGKYQCLVASHMAPSGATQVCSLYGNQTHRPFGSQPVLNPLSYTRQGYILKIL